MCIGAARRHALSHLFLFTTIVLVFTLCFPVLSRAQLSEVDEAGLSQTYAKSGISYVIGDSQYRITRDSFRISDTDHDPYNWIELNNIIVDDGSGNYFSMDTPENLDDVNRIDVGTNDLGQTSIFMNLSLNVEPRTYTVGSFVFCGQDLGSLRLESFRTAPSNMLTISGRADGTSGINLEYQTEIMIDAAKFMYNTTPEELRLGGIRLSRYAFGDPSDPSTWTFSGKFKVGDLENSNPATIDVGTADNGDGTTTTSVYYNLPMKGSIRVQDVNFGGNNFGPCAIDGINVHRLGIQIPGN